MNPLIDLYSDCKATIGKPISLKEVVEIIESDKYKKETEYLRQETDKGKRDIYKKQHLPLVTFGGIFSYRKKIYLKNASSLACLDIDIYDQDIEPLFQQIIKDKRVVLCFKSPSGGLKIVVKIPFIKSHIEYNTIYLRLLEDFKQYEPKQDTSTKDVSRLCFLSYDENIYVNYEAEEFKFVKSLKESTTEGMNDDGTLPRRNPFNKKDEKEKKEYSNGEIPKECRFIEEICCKKGLKSEPLARHTYLDPNVYVYLQHNKKNDLLEEYKKTQGREDSAFNESKKWKFSCSVLRKYIKENKGETIEEAKILCINCSFGKKIKKDQAKELQKEEKEEEDNTIYTSKYIDDERNIIVEQIKKDNKNQFCVFNTITKKIVYQDVLEYDDKKYKPIIDEEVIKNIVSLPSEAIEYNNDIDLDKEIIDFIYKYLDVSDETRMFAKWNIKRSWVFDRFRTLNYLRALGGFGEGKSRYLDVMGILHYKSIKTSGATTSAPVFRIIEKWRGTLVMDEADFDKSDESQDMIKIINLGFEKDQQIMRCEQNNAENINFFEPYCPKILATRREFQDKATESRCITEIMKGTTRQDIPVVLDDEFFEKGLVLRNKLLMWRFRNYHKIDLTKKATFDLTNIEPRIKQMVSSLIPLFTNEEEMNIFEKFVISKQEEIKETRKNSFEGKVVSAIYDLINFGNEKFSAKDIIESGDIRNTKGNLVTPRGLNSTLKILGFDKSKIERVGDTTKNCIPYEKEEFLRLAIKYGCVNDVNDVKVVKVLGTQRATLTGKDVYCYNDTYIKKVFCLHNNLNNLNTLTENNKESAYKVKQKEEIIEDLEKPNFKNIIFQFFEKNQEIEIETLSYNLTNAYEISIKKFDKIIEDGKKDGDWFESKPGFIKQLQ